MIILSNIGSGCHHISLLVNKISIMEIIFLMSYVKAIQVKANSEKRIIMGPPHPIQYSVLYTKHSADTANTKLGGK